MKKLLLFVLALTCALPVFAVRSNVVVTGARVVTATGALPDADISTYTRTGSFSLVSINTAGTSPTLAVKLQQASVPTFGASYSTVGTTTNKLRAGATTTNKLAAKFTQSGTKSIKYVDLWLKKAGTITSGKLVTLDVMTDSAAVPSGTSIGTSNTVGTDDITTSYTWIRFTFPIAVNVTDATVYHMVLSGDYTASTSNYIDWDSNTVASAGNQSTFDATTWTAVATESHMFLAWDTTFTDVTSGAFTGLTTLNNFQTLSFSLDGAVGGLVRPYATIGGTSTPTYYLALLLNAEAR